MRCNSPLAALMLLSACGSGVETRAATALPTPHAVAYGTYDKVGLASWYGDELAGRLTASGAHFDPAALTAAHRTLPLDSFVEVTSLDTGRSILVLVNDRGPGRRDREIDLSRGAAKSLGIDHNPLARVRIRNIAAESTALATMLAGTQASARTALGSRQLAEQRRRLPALAPLARVSPAARSFVATTGQDEGPYAVQVAAFSDKSRARALAKALAGNAVSADGVWRVRVGPFDRFDAAQRVRDDAARRGYGDARIVSFD